MKPAEGHPWRRNPGTQALRDRVRGLLRTRGPLSCTEIARKLGAPYDHVKGVLVGVAEPTGDAQRRWRLKETTCLKI